MELIKADGSLAIEQTNLNRSIKRQIFLDLFSRHNIAEGVQNGGYATYHLKNLENGEISLSVCFFEDIIIRISIGLGNKYTFPPFEMTSEEKAVLLVKLNSIGGARTYSWGKVELSEDPKGGAISIGIYYS